jgi:light-regulated signal transduction histidine kinase (bacteriophytochrome)
VETGWNSSIGCTLGIAVSEPDGTRALFFRNEVTDQVRLAGEPDTKIQHGPDGPRSSPRGSFSEHAETMTGKCEPWTQADRSVASELLSWILDLVYRDANGSNKRWRK